MTRARPMRQDAVRNQQFVLDAARDVLSEHGTEATMELIAARAGVGVGTVYRNFPNKHLLIEALVRSIFDELVSAARDSLTRSDGSGLERFLHILGRSFAEHRGYAAMLVGHLPADCGADQLRTLLVQLLERAQAAGRIGAWVTPGDVMCCIWAIRGVVETSGAVAASAWQRHLDIQLSALRRAEAASTRPSVSARQLATIAAVRA